MDKFFRSLLEIKWNIGKSRVSFLDALLLLAISGSGLVMRYVLMGGMSGCILGWYWIFDYVAAVLAAAVIFCASGSVTRCMGTYAVFLISPTILVLSSYWQKPDMCCGAFALASFLFLVKRKDIPAAICYFLAILMNAESIFLLPVFVVLWLFYYIGNVSVGIAGAGSILGLVTDGMLGEKILGRGNVAAADTIINGIKSSIEAFVLSGGDAAAVAAGSKEIAAGSSGSGFALSDRWANIYQLIGPGNLVSEYYLAGCLFTVAIIVAILVLVILNVSTCQDYLKDRMKDLNSSIASAGIAPVQIITEITLFFAILMPYLLPHMNARSGLIADLFALILLFLNLRRGWIALVQLIISFSMYQTYLTGIQRFPLAAYALAEGALLLITGYLAIMDCTKFIKADKASWDALREKEELQDSKELSFESREKIVIEEGTLRSALCGEMTVPILKAEVPFALLLFLIASIVIGIGIRFNFLSYVSQDYTGYWQLWFDEIHQGGGMKSLAGSWYDYSPLFMYFLVFIEGLPFNPMFSYKISMGVLDLVLAVVCGMTAKEITGSVNKGIFTTGVIFLVPTVMVNSCLWCQCDVIYVILLVLTLYEFMRNKGTRAMIFYSLAFCFKLQAAFVFPALVVLWVYKKVRAEHIFLIPAFYVASIIPAWLAGRPLKELLLVYFAQGYTDTWALTISWPNIYEIITPEALLQLYSTLGKCLIITMLMCTMYYMAKKKYDMTKDVMLEMFLFYGMLTVYFLPFMHERYGYLVDILSVIYAVRNPKRFYVPILHVLISYVSYTLFLSHTEELPMIWYAFLLLALMVIVGASLFAKMKTADLEEQHGIEG